MKITAVESITLLFRYPAARGFRGGKGTCTGRVSCLVRVHTDSGIVGIGSVYSHPELVRVIIEDHLRGMLIGEDPLDVEGLWEHGYELTRWYGRKGVAISALGGIDIALWDIRGKTIGKPICDLLGSKRHRVPAYASGLLWKEDLTELSHEATTYLKRGFRAMKMRLGRNYEYDCAALRIVRNTIGPHARLMIDANARYSVPELDRLIPEFHSQNAFWLEEPFPPEKLDDYIALHPKLGVPLAAGENEFGVQGFRELIKARSVDIVQPDCSRSGGVTECHRIGRLAARHGLSVATHTWSDAVALAANIHLVASLSNAMTVEVDCTGNALIDNLLKEPFVVTEGEIVVPRRPGLGIELDENALHNYMLPRGIRLPDGNYSDMIFGRDFDLPVEPYASTEMTPDEQARTNAPSSLQ